MLEIASQMILCLLLAALLGFIIGYLFGKGTCAGNECGQTTDTHVNDTETDSHSSNTIQATASIPAAVADASLTATTETNKIANISETTTASNNANDTSDNTEKIDTKETNRTTEAEADNASKNSDNSTQKENSSDNTDATTSPEVLTSPRNGKKDNLTRIKGIGAKIDGMLNDIGIYHFDQIAAWNKENLAWADKTLGFPGRAEREEWVAQAKALASGKETEFSKRVDEGKVSSSKKS